MIWITKRQKKDKRNCLTIHSSKTKKIFVIRLRNWISNVQNNKSGWPDFHILPLGRHKGKILLPVLSVHNGKILLPVMAKFEFSPAKITDFAKS